MGKNNRKRRAAKAKARAKAKGQGRPRGGGAGNHGPRGNSAWGSGQASAGSSDNPGFWESEAERVEALVGLAVHSRQRDDRAMRRQADEALAACPPAMVGAELERDLLMTLGALWDGGWLPGEVCHQVRRRVSVAASQVMGWAVAADHQRREPATIHPRWQVHVDKLDLPPVAATTGWLTARADVDGLVWPDALDRALAALTVASGLGPVAVIIPPPGSPDVAESLIGAKATIDLATDQTGAVMEKVRALLAQAESTTFEAEAETFTAKAQELMARHSIDAALLWGRTARDEVPTTIRIPLDDPYVDAKSLLLQVVAEHARCRAIFHSRYGMSAVVGFDVDLTATETLFTSLLIQAQAGMQRAAASAPAGSRTRSRGFRSSFFVAYANRIGERLAEVTARVESEVAGDPASEGSADLLPVLAARSSRVDTKVEEDYQLITTNTVRGGRDLLGWQAGHDAAEQADLGDEGSLQQPDPAPVPVAAGSGARPATRPDQERLPFGAR